MKKRTLILCAVITMLLGLVLAGCGQQAAAASATPAVAAATDSEAAETAVPETAAVPEGWNPDIVFTTVDTEGNEWTDLCFAEAKLTMLNLWAYWCPPCVGEMPDLQKLYEKYGEDGFRILGISMEEYEKDNILKMEELGVTYPTLRLTESIDQEMNTGYIPVTIFVDGEGHMVGELYGGSRSYAQWEKIIRELLK